MIEKSQVNELSDRTKEAADTARDNRWIERMARLGYATRGVLFGMVGLLAIQLLVTGFGDVTDQQGVLKKIASQPLGEIVLIVIAVGLAGLAVWGFIQAAASHYHFDSEIKRIANRLANLIYGLSNGALLVPTIRLIMGPDIQSTSPDQRAEQAAAGVFTQPWGPWLVGTVGLVVMGIGFFQLYRGITAPFAWQFDDYKINERQHRWAVRMGRIGTLAMGVVLITMGTMAILAAVNVDPQQVGGVDAALTFLLSQPYGRWQLGSVALGLIAYAAYAIMGALWLKFKN